MENSARYTLIGSFALACLVAAFGFVYWIKNVGGLGQREVYNVRFEQPVSGLTPGANVLFNGIRVGTVAAIALDPTRRPGERRDGRREDDERPGPLRRR